MSFEINVSECLPWDFSKFGTIIKSDWQTVKAFFTSTVHEITANGFLTYKTTHFQIFFPNLHNNCIMIKNIVSKHSPNVFAIVVPIIGLFAYLFTKMASFWSSRHMVSDINNKEKVKQVGGKINELIYSKPIPWGVVLTLKRESIKLQGSFARELISVLKLKEGFLLYECMRTLKTRA